MVVGRSTEVYAYLLLTRLRRRLIGTFFVGIYCDLCSRSSSCDNLREPAVQPEQSDAAGGDRNYGRISKPNIVLILSNSTVSLNICILCLIDNSYFKLPIRF